MRAGRPCRLQRANRERSIRYLWNRRSTGCRWLVCRLPIVDPAAPRKIVLATGEDGGANQNFGVKYAEVLGRNGISVELKTTAGSVENLELFADRNRSLPLQPHTQGRTRIYPSLTCSTIRATPACTDNAFGFTFGRLP